MIEAIAILFLTSITVVGIVAFIARTIIDLREHAALHKQHQASLDGFITRLDTAKHEWDQDYIEKHGIPKQKE